MANKLGASDRQVEPYQLQAGSGVVAAFLQDALEQAKGVLQCRPRASYEDVEFYLGDVADSVVGRFNDLTEPEKHQLWEALCVELLPYVPRNCQ
ncbi:hypothetical protein WK16_08795 [Burkholderia ubonensis]|nr:hypothetical protein WK16_08795 [Burkholderia ubonensis]